METLSYVVAGEGGTIREDKQRTWEIAAAIKEVGEARHRTEEVVGVQKVELDSFAERISLGGLDDDEHCRRVEMSTATL